MLVDARYADPGWRALLPPWWDYTSYPVTSSGR